MYTPKKSPRCALMLSALSLLLNACASSSPGLPATPAAIDPLPAEARQKPRSTSFSRDAESDIATWQGLLTKPSPPAASANAPTTR